MFKNLFVSACLSVTVTLLACGNPMEAAPEPVGSTTQAVTVTTPEAAPVLDTAAAQAGASEEPAWDPSQGLPEEWMSRLPEAERRARASTPAETERCGNYSFACCFAVCGFAGGSGPYCEGTCTQFVRNQCPGTSCQG